MAQTPIADGNWFLFKGIPYLGEQDAEGTKVMPSLQYVKNASGLFVPVSETDPMPAKLTGSNVTLQVASKGGVDLPVPASRSGVLAAGVSEIVLDVTKAIIIDHLIISTNIASVRIDLQPRNKSGVVNSRRAVSSNGSANWGTPTISDIAVNRLPEMMMLVNDTAKNEYIATLRYHQPLIWPFGGQIRVRNDGAADQNVACVISYRLMEV